MKRIRFITVLSILVIVVAVNALRFAMLDQSPPGFHVDELSGAVTVQCLAEEGIDALDNPYPLFADLNYGSPKPPTYIYFAMLWTKVFGYSFTSFRAISAFVTLLTILGLFLLGREMFGDFYALWVVLAGSVSPWVFQVSRIALEACLGPCFTVWGIYFFFRSKKDLDGVCAGILFALAMYSYPPMRLHIPLILGPLVFLKGRLQGSSKKFLVMCLTALVLTCVPLILGTLSGMYMGRFEKIGIFSQAYLNSVGRSLNMMDVGLIFFRNFLKHLDPKFLFVNGDDNLVYGTGFSGLFSWLDTFALVLGIGLLTVCLWEKRLKGRDTVYVGVLAICMLLAIVPSALTWQDIPHSLRMIGMWPFLSLLTGYVLWKATSRWDWMAVVPVCVAGVFAVLYLHHYFTVYPHKAYYMFSTFTKDQALAARTKRDWLDFIGTYRHQNFHLRYYVMNYLDGQTCSSSQRLWKEVHKVP